jgi:hypothetical protein
VGFLFDHRGNIESDYTWDLVVATNNEEKYVVIYQGIQRMKAHKIKQIIVVGNSSIIILFLLNLSTPQLTSLKWLI